MKKILVGASVAATALMVSVACTPTQAPEQSEPAPQEQEQEETAPQEQTPEPAVEPEVETSYTDGVFSYEVTGGIEQTHFFDIDGDPYFPDEDTFYIVEVTATNESNAPAYAPDPWLMEHLVAIDTEGREYAVDDEPWTGSFDTNPGSSVTYEAAWDLPYGVDIEYLEISAREAPGVAVLEAP